MRESQDNHQILTPPASSDHQSNGIFFYLEVPCYCLDIFGVIEYVIPETLP
jgi:hypothetical protein